MGPILLPSEASLAAFGVEEPNVLGGRVRRHWRVRRSGEDFVLTRYAESEASLRYEIRSVDAVFGLGWPVPKTVDGPIFADEAWWTIARLLPGEPPDEHDEPARRGRLLAEFHASVEGLSFSQMRPGFRRAERVLADPAIGAMLTTAEKNFPEETRIVRWHLERAHERLEGIDLATRTVRFVHGDFTAWNLRFAEGRLSAILDFELAREDHRVAEFAHAWRGKYDEVIHAYDETLPLEPVDWAMLTPVWWIFLVDLWCGSAPDDPWILSKLMQRSPLMGPDRDAFP